MCCACLGGEDISGDDEGLDGDGNGDGNGDGDGAVPSAEELAIQAENAAAIATALVDDN